MMEYFNIKMIKNAFLIICGLLLWPTYLYADEPQVELILKPNQCVAMQQGQQCYVDIVFSWKSTQVSDYCLYSSQDQRALKCWQSTEHGFFGAEIESNKNVRFYIKHPESQRILATAELEMAWVYKKTNRSNVSWRMF